MIRNLIFDFGNVFVDLDLQATVRTLMEYGVEEIPARLYQAAYSYEKGQLNTAEFVHTARALLPGLSEDQLITAWNAILLEIPDRRLEFLRELAASNAYRIFLLSNSNSLHIDHLTQRWGRIQMEGFLSHFDGIYFSHEMGMRKPDPEIFRHILNTENLLPDECFFVDDSEENTEAAARLGLHTWHLKAGREDVCELHVHLP